MPRRPPLAQGEVCFAGFAGAGKVPQYDLVLVRKEGLPAEGLLAKCSADSTTHQGWVWNSCVRTPSTQAWLLYLELGNVPPS